ncbi:Prion-like protein doppel, partial [Ophiophagus hannah]
MWKNLLFAVLLAGLYSNVCLRRSSSYRRQLWKKLFKNVRKNSTTLKNLCYGSEMIDNMTLEANDTIFYRDNAKEFPNGVFYPNCSLPLQLNESSETQIEECVDFIITSSNLSLPDGKNASEPSKRVMWLVINHLCANESCSLPCPRSSNVSSAHYFTLMMSLVAYSILSSQ